MQLETSIHHRQPASELVYARFLARIVAFAYDYVVIASYLFVLLVLAYFVNTAVPTLQTTLFGNRLTAQLTGFLLITLPVILYFAILQSSSWQATLGKRIMRLNVLDTNGARLSFPRALFRSILQFIPWELSHTLIWQLRFDPNISPLWLTLGFTLVWVIIAANLISILITPKHQTLYDLAARTIVIRLP